MRTIYQVDIRCDECEEIVQAKPPVGRWKWAAVGAFLLGLIGLFIGLSVGVATAGFGVVAAVFTVPIGIYSGYKSGRYIAMRRDPPSCPDCGNRFGNNKLLSGFR